MSASFRQVRLQPDERVIVCVRQYLVPMAGQIIATTLLVLLPFFLLVALLNWQPWGGWVLAALFVSAMFVAARFWIRWAGTYLVLTNQRIIDIDQRGIWERVVSAAPLDRIGDVHFSQKGIGGALFGYGLIEYSVAPGQTRIASGPLRRPQQIYQEIIAASQGDEPGGQMTEEDREALLTVASVDDLVMLLKRLRGELGPAKFSRIVGQVDPAYWRYRVKRAAVRRQQKSDTSRSA